MYDARLERERADRSIHALMVNSWRVVAVIAIAMLALAGFSFAVLIAWQ